MVPIDSTVTAALPDLVPAIAGREDELQFAPQRLQIARRKIELVAVLHVAGAFDDDVGRRLEQADQLFNR